MTTIEDEQTPANRGYLVIACVRFHTELRPLLESHGLAVNLLQMQISRGVPLAKGTRLAPLNPVVVLRGCRV